MKDLSTEQKIIEAARTVFTKKGFAATRTRDIADEAGINLALLNYYFGSKKKLFEMVMAEKVKELFGNIAPTLSSTTFSLQEKVERLVTDYTDLLLANPDLPLFVLNELKADGAIFRDTLQNARILSQPIIEEQLAENGYHTSLLDFILNVVSLTIFPFIAKPLYLSAGSISEADFTDFVRNREKEIPGWIFKTLQ